MSHAIEELDNVMLGSNTPAWHNLGTVVKGQPGSAEAIKLAGLDWEVITEPTFVSDGQGGYVPVFGAKAVVRTDLSGDDQRRALGVVTDRYEPITNAEAFAIVDDLAGEGDARFETAGSLRNGRTVFMTAVLPNMSDVKGDRIARYLLLATSHDGSKACEIKFTPVRVVCANTLSCALAGSSKGTAKIRHTRNKKQQVRNAKEVLGLAGEYFDEHTRILQSMSDAAIDQRFASAYLSALIPDPPPDQPQKWSTASKKRERILQLYNGEQAGGDHGALKGTAYGLYNAVTEWVDHERTALRTNGRSSAEARMESTVFGNGAAFKEQAFRFLNRALDLGDKKDETSEHDKEVDDLLSTLDV